MGNVEDDLLKYEYELGLERLEEEKQAWLEKYGEDDPDEYWDELENFCEKEE